MSKIVKEKYKFFLILNKEKFVYLKERKCLLYNTLLIYTQISESVQWWVTNIVLQKYFKEIQWIYLQSSFLFQST